MSKLAGQFSCDGCGRMYRWKSELAGCKVKCRCGQVMTAPSGASVDDDMYDIVDDEPVAPAPKRVVATASAPPRALAYAGASVASPDSAMERYFPDRVKD